MKQDHPKILMSACLRGEPVRYDAGSNKIESEMINKWLENNQVILVCPEVLGGLSVPRQPCEIDQLNDRVVSCVGVDCTAEFLKGAYKTLEIAHNEKPSIAIMKERSPSCGVHEIYDGTFSKTKIKGQGITVKALEDVGIKCFNENEISDASDYLDLIEKGENA